MPPVSGLTLAVLVGGRSRRMGRDKATIDAGGVPLAARPGLALGGLVDEVILAGRSVPGVAGRPVDDAAGAVGPLAGVVAALRAARTPLVVVAACDAPFLAPGLVARLVETLVSAPGARVAAGSSWAGLEPLPAVLRREAAEPLLELAGAGVQALRRAWEELGLARLDAATCAAVDPGGGSFESWNRPADVRRLPPAPRN